MIYFTPNNNIFNIINDNGKYSYLKYIKINENNLNIYNYRLGYNKIYNNILNGNIKRYGPVVKINNDNIKLKLHQQRMVYEMIQRENINYRLTSRINAFVLSDK